MTEHNWKPGDVAMVTMSAREGGGQQRGMVDAFGWATVDGGTWATKASRGVLDARPLVVIDPEDREQVERLASDFMAADDPLMDPTRSMQAALREFAAPTPPKPDEPLGLGAVVEDSDGMLWVRANRTRSTPWVAPVTTTRAEAYDDIDVARVLSEGVVA